MNWFVENGKLCHELVFDSPLTVGGDEVADNLIAALDELDIENTDHITADIVEDPSIINF